MSFTEFLATTGNGNLADLLRFIGGMPEVVASFAEQQDYREVRRIQTRLLAAYEQDFSKHAPYETMFSR